MKKKTPVFLLALIALTVIALFPAGGAAQETETVKLIQCAFGDGGEEGLIAQTELTLEDGETVRIDMSEVYDMYPEHTGVYGILYTSGEVTLRGDKDSGKAVSGTGVKEFSFPGATGCEISGTGKVYAFFLPVPYMRLSTSVSLTNQKFDTSYLTPVASGHSNMFIITDPHVYIWQDNIPYANTVYKTSFGLGPIPSEYKWFDTEPEDPVPDSLFPFLYNLPVVVQCDAINATIYNRDTYSARPMVEYKNTADYAIWVYKDFQTQGSILSETDKIFSTCTELAHEEVLAPGLKIDKILAIIMGSELGETTGSDGTAHSDEKYHQLGYTNWIFVQPGDGFSSDDYYLFAHEIGHIIHSASLTAMPSGYAKSFLEGFATWFGEKAARRMGKPYSEPRGLDLHDSLEIQKFKKNLVFGCNDFETFVQVKEKGELDQYMLAADNPYALGGLFFDYLESRYGEGFYKKASALFYQTRYKGHESNFFYRRSEFNYKSDDYYALFRKAFGEDVYTAFPDYLYKHQADKVIRCMRIPAGLKRIEGEAFRGLSGNLCFIFPEGIQTIAPDAFQDTNATFAGGNDYVRQYAQEHNIPYSYENVSNAR